MVLQINGLLFDVGFAHKSKPPLSYDAVLMRSSEGVSVVTSISDVVGSSRNGNNCK